MPSPAPITPDAVFKAFAGQGQPPRWLLQSDRQDAYIVEARAAVALVLHDNLGLSWAAVGRELNRVPTSVMRLAKQYRDDRETRELVTALCESLGVKAEICTAEGVGP